MQHVVLGDRSGREHVLSVLELRGRGSEDRKGAGDRRAMAQDCARCHVLAEHVLELRGRAHVSGRRGSRGHVSTRGY